MVELLMPLAVFGSFVLVVGQVTRLLSNVSLNRTLREALRANPASVRLLAERLDARQPWADALVGWIFIAFAAGLALMSLFEEPDERADILQAAIVPLIVGIVVIAYVRWAKAESARDVEGAAASRPPAAPSAPTATPAPMPPIPPRPRRRPTPKGGE